MKKRLNHIFFFFFVLFSCKQFTEKKITLRKEVTQLMGVEALKNHEKGKMIFIADTLLILSRPKTDDYFYSVYGLKSNKFLGSLIKKGRGMQEFSTVLYYGQHEKDSSGIKIWIADFITMEMDLINVSASVFTDKTIVEKRIPFIHKRIPEPAFLFYLPGGKIAGFHNVVNNDQPLQERFFLLDPIITKVEFREVPNIGIDSEIERSFQNRVYSSMAKLKPDKKRILDMKRYQPKINIVDNNGNHINSFILESDFPKSFKKLSLGTIGYKIYNYWIDASDKYIYILRANNGLKTLNEGMNICVLDWDGNMIKNLQVKDQILSFAVDEKNQFIYGLVSQNQILYKYKLL